MPGAVSIDPEFDRYRWGRRGGWSRNREDPSSDDNTAIAGYRQSAFWNGLVASVSTRWLTDEEEAARIYSSALAYMAEDGRTIARAGETNPDFFTDSISADA